MSRCTGHCCKAFSLPLSPENLADEVRLGFHSRISEIGTIADMVIYLGKGWMDVVTASFTPVYTANSPGDPTRPGYIYTCRHLRPNGDCGIYAVRPAMCKDYPYGSTCRFDRCTAKQAG